MRAPRIGVLLSGCGFLDGSEIHESVLTLLHLDRAGATAICMAPRGPQLHVVDHATAEQQGGGTRDMLVESARIARGQIRDVAEVRAGDLDGMILPGGFGAAKNLCDFAAVGAKATPHAEVARLLRELHAARKPIGAICIAPALLASVLGRTAHPTLTIGEDAGTAAAIQAMGGRHQACAVTGFAVDPQNRIVSTPAYMFHARIGEVAQGIERLVQAVVAMARGEAVSAGASA
jgi:enhancing lycopene biosynthesis protein 2